MAFGNLKMEALPGNPFLTKHNTYMMSPSILTIKGDCIATLSIKKACGSLDGGKTWKAIKDYDFHWGTASLLTKMIMIKYTSPLLVPVSGTEAQFLNNT
ncbi:MAG: hypothetical protein IPN72_06475 [Saprospiraceae bacterium]|nr:hypothetical protein [Saprospiraceae bacterium]